MEDILLWKPVEEPVSVAVTPVATVPDEPVSVAEAPPAVAGKKCEL